MWDLSCLVQEFAKENEDVFALEILVRSYNFLNFN